MTREEFQEIVHEIADFEYVKPVIEDKARGIKGCKGGYTGVRKTLSVEWMTGGAWGGNCWGDSEPSSYCPEAQPEKELTELDEILLRVCPNLTFLQYKKITNNIKYDTRRSYEYYGNHTDYATKSIKVDDIWNSLKEMNLV